MSARGMAPVEWAAAMAARGLTIPSVWKVRASRLLATVRKRPGRPRLPLGQPQARRLPPAGAPPVARERRALREDSLAQAAR